MIDTVIEELLNIFLGNYLYLLIIVALIACSLVCCDKQKELTKIKKIQLLFVKQIPLALMFVAIMMIVGIPPVVIFVLVDYIMEDAGLSWLSYPIGMVAIAGLLYGGVCAFGWVRDYRKKRRLLKDSAKGKKMREEENKNKETG